MSHADAVRALSDKTLELYALISLYLIKHSYSFIKHYFKFTSEIYDMKLLGYTETQATKKERYCGLRIRVL
jgi:hypothetical protein